MFKLTRVLDNEYEIIHIKIPFRYILSTSIVVFTKFLLAALLYTSQQVGTIDGFWMDVTRVEPLVQNAILTDAGNRVARWAYLFLGWDSAWYASIAENGYSFSSQSFAFMPVFPSLARLLESALGGVLPSIAICSLVVGVVWVPLFQSVAEYYLEKSTAIIGTILFALSPFTLLFTTVAYSEGLFLLITLAAWRLYLDKRYFSASIASSIAVLVRVPGFLIVLPMAVHFLLSREKNRFLKAVLISLPTIFAMLCWMAFMGVSGDALAFLHTTEWSGMYTLPIYFTRVLPEDGYGALSFPEPYFDVHWLLPLAVWVSLILLPFLLKRLFMIDLTLGIYCLAYSLGVLMSGAVVSIPRFLAVLFPLWLVISKSVSKREWIWVPVLVSISVSYILWVGFLSGVFVG